ncbi:hypothetical protein BC826DRAFT_971447 [Russula brevipes]|nr:hypothetical protein BC826DRAFT_971447 [Russula brevipes]
MFLSSLRILFTLALAVALGVSAQTNLDRCVLTCVQQALSNSTCTAITDISCICGSSSFQTTAAACLNATCTAAEQQQALGLQQQQCGSSSPSPTQSGTSSPASTSKKSSNAAPLIVQLPFVTAVIAIAGVALGGALSL